MTIAAPTGSTPRATARRPSSPRARAARAGARRSAGAEAEVARHVVAVLGERGARRVALAADLGAVRDAVRAACAAAGIDADDYEAVAASGSAALGALDATVTGCAAALAPTGSILTTASAGRGAALIAPLHVCVVREEQLLGGLTELLRALPRLGAGSLAALQTGPSRTADIEKVLVIGAHGPAVVEVVLAASAG